MTAATYLQIAARNLLQARRRSLLLSLALAVVTALLVLLLALAQGLSENMIRSATTLAAGHVNVAGFYKTTPSDAAPVLIETARVRQIIREAVPELDYVVDRHRGWAKLASDTGSTFAALSGIDPSQEQRLIRALLPAPERAYKDGGGEAVKGELTRLGEPGTIVLFAAQAKRLGVVPGDALTVVAESFRGSANSTQVTVIAVAEDVGLISFFQVLVSKHDVLELYQLQDDTTGSVLLYLRDLERADEVMGTLRRAFEAEGYGVLDHAPAPFFHKLEGLAGEDWSGQRLDVTTWRDEVASVSWVITAFDAVSFFLVLVLTAIIAIGIMNTMWMSVRERTAEVGTLRAIGMRGSRVLLMFLTEALLLGAAATTAGGVLGGALALGLDALRIELPFDAARVVLLSSTLHLSFHPGQVGVAIVALTTVTGLSALWPASRAAKLQPVTAIQQTE